MTLPLTAEMLEACYEFLKTTPPFRDWNMPDGEDVKFIIRKTNDTFAQYRWDGKRHTISASANAVGHTATLVRVMSHELIHLHLESTGMESRGSANTHNRAFRKFAA